MILRISLASHTKGLLSEWYLCITSDHCCVRLYLGDCERYSSRDRTYWSPILSLLEPVHDLEQRSHEEQVNVKVFGDSDESTTSNLLGMTDLSLEQGSKEGHPSIDRMASIESLVASGVAWRNASGLGYSLACLLEYQKVICHVSRYFFQSEHSFLENKWASNIHFRFEVGQITSSSTRFHVVMIRWLVLRLQEIIKSWRMFEWRIIF